MRFHHLPSIPSLEPLEPRLLLSAETSFPLTLAPHDGALEALEGVTTSIVQGADEAGPFVDAGDYYWCYGKQVSLLRVANEAVVRFGDPTTAQSALSQVTAPGGVLEGYEWSRAVDPEMFVFRKQAGGDINFDGLNQGLHASGIAEWAAPAFVDAQTGSPLYTGSAIIVALKPGVDPNVFFQDFAGIRRLSRNEYVVTVEGGGLATLEAANRLYGAAGPRVALFDAAAEPRAFLAVLADGPTLSLTDAAGKTRAFLRVHAKGPGLFLLDVAGKQRASLAVAANDSVLVLYDAAGKAIWRAP